MKAYVMNTLVIVLIAAVLLSAAYVLYGCWLANKWGIDPKAETPAKKFEDGKRQYQVLYVPLLHWHLPVWTPLHVSDMPISGHCSDLPTSYCPHW